MKNENKYAKKWYERYHTIAIGCIILSISLVIMLLYFLLIENLFDVIVICVILSILCKGDKNDALDNCILNKLLPILKTLEFKISEGSEDEDLLATVDNIFGLENLNKSQEYLRKINQEKF